METLLPAMAAGPGRFTSSGRIHAPLVRGDVVLLLTDGAWTPLSLHALQRLVAGAALGGFADLPARILEAAGRRGRADDLTAVVARLRA